MPEVVGMAERIEGGGAGAAAGYAKFCRPCVVATVDSLQAPRAGEKGRGRVILCRGADRRAERRLERRSLDQNDLGWR